MTCNQDCNQGRNCNCAPTIKRMSEAQMGWLYFWLLLLVLLVAVFFRWLTYKPMSAEDYANKMCQELHGPQTAAYYVADRMMCISAKGEILPTKKP